MSKTSKKKARWFKPKEPPSKHLPAKPHRRGGSINYKKRAKVKRLKKKAKADAGEDVEVAEKKEPTRPFDMLGNELLLEVFVNLDAKAPQEWELTCKRFHSVASSAHVRSNFFLRRYPSAYVIQYSLTRSHLYLRTPELLKMLIIGGALFSRYLVQCLIRSQTNGEVNFEAGGAIARWGAWSRVPFPVFALFTAETSERFGNNMPPTPQGVDDSSIFQNWVRDAKSEIDIAGSVTLLNSSAPLVQIPDGSDLTIPDLDPSLIVPETSLSIRERRWRQIAILLTYYGFHPLSPYDVLHAKLPHALTLHPRLLPLLAKNGYTTPQHFQDEVLRRVLISSEAFVIALHNQNPTANTPQARAGLVAQQVTMYTGRSTQSAEIGPGLGWKLSRELMAEMLIDDKSKDHQERNDLARVTLEVLEKEGALVCNPGVVLKDMMMALSGTRFLWTQIPWVQRAYKYWRSEYRSSVPLTDEATALVLSTAFYQAQGTQTTNNRYATKGETYRKPWTLKRLVAHIAGVFACDTQGDWRMIGVKEIERMLKNPFILPDMPLALASSESSGHFSIYENFDAHRVVRSTVIHIILKAPWMGVQLLSLARLYPQLVASTVAELLSSMDLNLVFISQWLATHVGQTLATSLVTPYRLPWKLRRDDEAAWDFVDGRFLSGVRDRLWVKEKFGGVPSDTADIPTQPSSVSSAFSEGQEAEATPERTEEQKQLYEWWRYRRQRWASRPDVILPTPEKMLGFPEGALDTWPVVLDLVGPKGRAGKVKKDKGKARKTWVEHLVVQHAILNRYVESVKELEDLVPECPITLRLFEVCAATGQKIPPCLTEPLLSRRPPQFLLDESWFDRYLDPNPAPLDTPTSTSTPSAVWETRRVWAAQLKRLVEIEEAKLRSRRGNGRMVGVQEKKCGSDFHQDVVGVVDKLKVLSDREHGLTQKESENSMTAAGSVQMEE